MEASTILRIILGVSVLFILVLFFMRLKVSQDEIAELISEKFSSQNIIKKDPLALHVAQESKGYSQSRGNGQLILTEKELFFAMPCPKTIISIPVSSIQKVGTTRRMGGKSVMSLLLKVDYISIDGAADALALKVKDLEGWQKTIEGLLGEKNEA